MDISLCMIVKDEEDVICRCINCVKDIVDEIIVVDTGSKDSTIEKVRSFNAKVYYFDWIEDFSKARNYAFSKASKDYILWLDADDIIEFKDQEKLKLLKENLDENIDVVSMNYILSSDNSGNPLYSLRRNRLVKRSKDFKWIGFIHEYLDVRGNILDSDINIVHKKEKEYSNRNLKIYEKQISKGIKLSTRDIYYYANELYDNARYDDAIREYINFINTNEGWEEDIKGACSKLADCYRVKNDTENELRYIFKSFEYGIPRSDFCCRLGYKFLENNKIEEAIYWYKLALQGGPKKNSMNLINHDTYTYLPWIQLCVCYYKLGNINDSYYCNEMAGKYKPNDYLVKYNRKQLKEKMKNLKDNE